MYRILVVFHTESNYGFAIAPLERTFFMMARKLAGKDEAVHFSYIHLEKGFPMTLPSDFPNVIAFDPSDPSVSSLDFISEYVRKHKINIVFGFDLPVSNPSYKVLRQAGVQKIITYWGAPMSQRNHGLKLLCKKIEVVLRRYKPNHFIFESQAMADLAVFGRGISVRNTSIIPLGVDTEIFRPKKEYSTYPHEQFNFSLQKKIIVYTGHMEKRKGVQVLLRACRRLVEERNRKEVVCLILGNHDGNENKYAPLYVGTEAEKHIVFGGYRSDVPRILSGCFVGVIPSTGWDSFPRSALEMMASGLPLVVSRLQGLVEQVEQGKNGFLFSPGDDVELADRIEFLLESQELYEDMSKTARVYVLERFSIDVQVRRLLKVVRDQ